MSQPSADNVPTDGPDIDGLLNRLSQASAQALQRVYQLDQATPINQIMIGEENKIALSLKREDTSTVHSYKWRGAYNKIATLVESGFDGALVAASAGNHAQGVALAAAGASLKATIFMPRSTPLVKQDAVRELGGPWVDIRLVGDSFDQSAEQAKQFVQQSGGMLIPPYDDLHVIAGQSTIGVELLDQLAHPPTHAFLPIGGGGMAAGVASILKKRSPSTRLIGVEAVNQNSMGVSIAGGRRQTVGILDRFCDGTAVACPGELPFMLCQHLIDEFVTVSNVQVCDAIESLWQKSRIIVEPSAALGVAAAFAYSLSASDRAVTILSGSNVDFQMLPKIARRGQLNRPQRRYIGFEIDERPGQLDALLQRFPSNMNIIDFQYGKVAESAAYPIIGVEVPRSEVGVLEAFLDDVQLPPHHDVTGSAAIDFRVIPFNYDLLAYPYFAVIQFPNRPGALGEFMNAAGKLANVCYMNYTDDGQTEGLALMGFEFETYGEHDAFVEWLDATTEFQPVPMAQIRHINSLGANSERLKAFGKPTDQ